MSRTRRKFMTRKQAYERGQFYGTLMYLVGVEVIIAFLVGSIEAVLFGLVLLGVMSKARKFWRAFFFNSALQLDSSKDDSEPDCFAYITETDKRRFNQMAFDKFTPQEYKR